MNEVGSGWPLIRRLMDDPVYNAEYRAQLRAFTSNVFTAALTDSLFGRHHALITPYVIGANGERPGATYLGSSQAFTSALGELRAHASARRTLIAGFVP